MDLWEHQKQAVDIAMRQNHFMLAHDMGCGKSNTAITIINRLDCKSVIIVCPKSVMDVWPHQFKKHSEKPFKVTVLNQKSVKKKHDVLKQMVDLHEVNKNRCAFIINYDSVWREPIGYVLNNKLKDIGLILSKKWDMVLLDESHRIKSHNSKVSRFCSRLATVANYRLCLSGTPMSDNPLDVFGQYRFLNSNIFGRSFHMFKLKYTVLGGYMNKQIITYRNLENLNSKFYSIAHVVKKEDALTLPETMHEILHFCLSGKAQKIYDSLEQEFYAQVETGEITVANALTKLLRLQQLTGGFAKLDDSDVGIVVDNSKLELLEDLLEGFSANEPLVIFCNFTNEIQRIKTALAKKGRTSAELTGRKNELEEWQDCQKDVLVVQIRAGGVGIDLTRSHYAIYYSLGFSLINYEQSLARTHRPGQTNKVTYYHLVCKNSVDEKVYKALKSKKKVVDSIIKGGREV